ncbi:MAG: galactokinase, partial [Abditibacteriota bacterium]|nr:galactokinase [Abditibacteriota bacterium]
MNTSNYWTAEAPGRLDVLGGVADYSGSLVLQTPIRGRTRVTIVAEDTPDLRLTSVSEGETTLSLEALRPLTKSATACAIDTRAIRSWLEEQRVPHWAHYSVGCLLLFCGEMNWWPDTGLSFHIESDVPASMGVSSSAALEVATLRALEKVAGQPMQGTRLARMAQQAENEIVGAPCGLMDQLASAHGIQSTLLPILCRPDVLDEPVPLPAGIIAVGWPSGVKH